MSSNPAVKEFIASKASTAQDDQLRQNYTQMKDLYDKKLWHQLTLKLSSFVKLPQFDRGVELIELYDRFIRDFEAKINQLELVKIALSIRRQITDVNDAVNWLQKISEKISSESQKEAYSYILAEIAWLKLNLGLLDDTKALTDKIAGILDTITGADPIVYSAFYRVLSLYYKRKVAPTEFYRNSLLFLVYTPLEQVPLAEQASLAFDMGLAALVANDIHNFGELLAHPVLKSLDGSKHAWLKEFLFAFNSGDLERFERLFGSQEGD
jgi:26S proteasome regulatory subunit N9